MSYLKTLPLEANLDLLNGVSCRESTCRVCSPLHSLMYRQIQATPQIFVENVVWLTCLFVVTDWIQVSFMKGCYLGQELTARTHFRGTLARPRSCRSVEATMAV